jgi:integrase
MMGEIMAAKRRTKGAGSVRRMASGRYQARIIGPDGQRHSAQHTFETKMDAVAWLNSKEQTLRNGGDWEDPKKLRATGSLTLNRFFYEWIDDQDHIRETTSDHYKYMWRSKIFGSVGELSIASVSEKDVKLWRQNLDPDFPVVREQAYALLRQILKEAVAAKHIPSNPAPVHSFGFVMPREEVILTPDEVVELAENMPPRYRALVYVSAWCALRFGESAGLERRDIDLDAAVIHVRRGVVRTRTGVKAHPPKSRAGLRKVTIPSHILTIISDHLEEFVTPESKAKVFGSAHNDGKAMAPSTLYKVFYPARERIGYPNMHWHDLRHTGGTMAAQAGATLRELQERLGHSTVSAAMRYQHSTETRQAELAEKLATLANSSKAK